MQITRLKLLGFKSFVEPAELLIEPGLTGVVGPNGCGKSNLLEALRWVMGETSYKSMRGSAMDDVIFSGTDARPARDTAEVTIYLDNSARRAPAAFNDTDNIEIARRIQRESGSTYKVNGREARARDVQLLFADAATGARSQALVQQGRIGEIVSAKPEQRRRILEDAAGIAGLHGRRHEAELRLKAAESNLERLQDVMGQVSSQLQSLKRQARQARKYREISEELRQAEAIQHHILFQQANEKVAEEEAALQEAMREVGQLTQAESAATRAESEGSDSIQPLRDEEATRAAVLHRLQVEQQTLEQEEARAAARQKELQQRLEQIAADISREREMMEDAAQTIGQLEAEEAALRQQDDTDDGRAEAAQAVETASQDLEAAEQRLSDLTSQAADLRARRRELEGQIGQADKRIASLTEQQERLARDLAEVDAALGEQSEIATLQAEVTRLGEAVGDVEARTGEAETALAEARTREKEAREHASQTRLKARELETEAATLIKLLRPDESDQWRPIVDEIRVAPGYEAALGAALGDDLDMPADRRAPAHWAGTGDASGDPALPAGATPFTEFVRAPDVLTRRLRQIGLVDPADGPRLAAMLAPGQRLVTTRGDLWRWDGVHAAADAPTAAAKRLAERNRLDELTAEVERLSRAADEAEAQQKQAAEHASGLADEDKRLRAQWRETQAELSRARDALAKAEREAQKTGQKRAALVEGQNRIAADLEDARNQRAEARAALEALADTSALEQSVSEAQAVVSGKRDAYSQARSRLDGIERDRKQRHDRLQGIAAELTRAAKRRDAASAQITDLEARSEQTRSELEELAGIPESAAQRREKLFAEIEQAEAARREAADKLAEAESSLRDNAKHLRDIQSRLSAAKEKRARLEAQLEAARQRRSERAHSIRENLDCAPEECLRIAGFEAGAQLPDAEELDRRIHKLRGDRERLGGVNLRAEEEAQELEEQYGGMQQEHEDLEQAISKLRNGIASLNKEGRKRLLDAFETVNNHFEHLFSVLFAGGEARLELIESDDPLEAGLEIVARPPGKKSQVLTLLSGGEKALTALALIFAVFLTNPSPICVLDEVDAPLDDANVDRFCNLMEEMGGSTQTRFLVITHHPMTMSRMHRLFGVTMAEKGVSQLVSVDLRTAERFLEAS
ncbi:MAG: AAA family ATPase [Dichotomicrobium sp.]